VELHGFLSYLVKVALTGGRYAVYGYKGKQVRDNIHSYDVVRAIEEFAANPRPGEVYNMGGGREKQHLHTGGHHANRATKPAQLDWRYVRDGPIPIDDDRGNCRLLFTIFFAAASRAQQSCASMAGKNSMLIQWKGVFARVGRGTTSSRIASRLPRHLSISDNAD